MTPETSIFETGEVESLPEPPVLGVLPDVPEDATPASSDALRLEMLQQAWNESREAGCVRSPNSVDQGILRRYPDNESGFADRFVDQLGAFVRFVRGHPDAGKSEGLWIIWHPVRGWVLDTHGQIKRLMVAHLRGLMHPAMLAYVSADSVVRVGSKAGINNLISLAQTRRTILPSDIDTDPFLLACPTKVIDVRTGGVRPHRIEDILVKRIAIDPKAGRKPGRALAKILSRKMARPMRRLLQDFLATTLNGQTTQRLFTIWQGPSGSGKTSITRAVGRLLGDYAVAVDASVYTTDRDDKNSETQCAMMVGKRFVYATEMDTGKTLSLARIKRFSGGDTFLSRALYQAHNSSKATQHHLLSLNELPVVRGRDRAFWRRVLIINADAGISEEREDTSISYALENEQAEQEGLLNWILAANTRLSSTGWKIEIPEESKCAKEQYCTEQDFVGQYLSQECDSGPGLRVSKSDLYRNFAAWASKGGFPELSAKAFHSQIKGDVKETKIKGFPYYTGLHPINPFTPAGI